ncbi:SpoIIE family protein phosphatase [Streptomyces sp. NPDC004134]|uniref:ATP-binding SpoIIE family protein phosphatase n=1 Tax=Streptomyces sp. NPDC004134 TaxID=3364691 RepID=UPI00368A049D
MRTEEVLAAVGTGVWSWDAASGTVTMDAEAARLVGLPGRPTETTAADVRGRCHGVDYVELAGAMDLARTEGTVAEARLRIVDERGTVLRVVRTRMRPFRDGEPAEGGHGTDRAPGTGPDAGTGGPGAGSGTGTGPAPTSPVAAAGSGDVVMSGIVQEVVEPPPEHSAPERYPEPGAGASPPSPPTSDWRLSREAFLLDAGRALAESRGTDQVLRVAASLSMPGFSPDGMAVFGVEGNYLKVIGQHGYRPEDEEPFHDIPLDSDYPGSVAVRTGRAIYIAGREEYRRRFPEAWRLAGRLGRRSWAYVPLIVAGRVIGVWLAAFSHPAPFTPDERSVLTTVARMLAQALSRAHVHESERELSAGLQRSLMPEEVPPTPGMTVAARYVPTGGGLEIGGDWYDVITLPSGKTAVVIGDVQGHDVRAAGLMSQLRIAIRAYASEGHHPDAVLTRASHFLTQLNQREGLEGDSPPDDADPRFATCLYIKADPATGTLHIARAGHLDPAMGIGDGTLLVRPTEGGLPLGVVEDPDYPVTRLVLEPGELMLLCSDGLIETGGHDLETGRDRLRRAFAGHVGDGLEALADALIDAVSGPGSHATPGPHAERREDDIALVLLRRDLPPAEGEPGAAPTGRHMHLTVPQAEQQRTADARHELRAMLFDWSAPAQVDSAELVLSELIANVLLHTDSDADISADVDGPRGNRTLRVTVSDADTGLPHLRHPGEMSSSGRGLFLLQELSGEWGTEPRGDGKEIWCEFHEED